MGFPKFRKVNEDIVYTWDFNISEPLPPLVSRLNKEAFENICQHPSGFTVANASVGTRVDTHAVSNNRFFVDVTVSTSEMEIFRQFFLEGSFWFYPDSDVDEGNLVVFMPRDFRPEPAPNATWNIQGELVEIGRDTAPNVDDAMTSEMDKPFVQIVQQDNAISGLSYIYEDNPERDAIFTFVYEPLETSDWTVLDAHIIRHETNYTDRHGRMLFNWVRRVKKMYFIVFDAIDEDFIKKLAGFISCRKGRFYPKVVNNIKRGDWDSATVYARGDGVINDDDCHISIQDNNANNEPPDDTYWVLQEEGILVYPPKTDYINVQIVEKELHVVSQGGFFSTSITLEEI